MTFFFTCLLLITKGLYVITVLFNTNTKNDEASSIVNDDTGVPNLKTLTKLLKVMTKKKQTYDARITLQNNHGYTASIAIGHKWRTINGKSDFELTYDYANRSILCSETGTAHVEPKMTVAFMNESQCWHKEFGDVEQLFFNRHASLTFPFHNEGSEEDRPRLEIKLKKRSLPFFSRSHNRLPIDIDGHSICIVLFIASTILLFSAIKFE